MRITSSIQWISPANHSSSFLHQPAPVRISNPQRTTSPTFAISNSSSRSIEFALWKSLTEKKFPLDKNFRVSSSLDSQCHLNGWNSLPPNSTRQGTQLNLFGLELLSLFIHCGSEEKVLMTISLTNRLFIQFGHYYHHHLSHSNFLRPLHHGPKSSNFNIIPLSSKNRPLCVAIHTLVSTLNQIAPLVSPSGHGLLEIRPHNNHSTQLSVDAFSVKSGQMFVMCFAGPNC